MSPASSAMADTAIGSSSDTKASKLRVILSSSVGTFVEWYDFYIYGTAAGLVFPEVFFPTFDPTVGVIASLGTLAVGYFSRPLGAAIYGHYGDRVGRKKMLVTSLLLMGIATFLIGLVPSYAAIGIAAPMALIFLRFIQGIAAGGEWGGAALMALEHAPPGRRGLWSSSVQSASFLGTAASAATFAFVSQFMSRADFLAWGWRIPFLAAALLVGIGLWVRLRVEESPVFKDFQTTQATEAKQQVPIAKVFSRDWGVLVRAVLLVIGPFAFSTVFVAVAPRFITNMGTSAAVATSALTIGLLVPIVGAVVAGWLSDVFGRRPIYILGCVLSAVAAGVALQLFTTGSESLIIWGFVIVYAAHSFAYGNIPAFVSEQFPTDTRYTGGSLAYHVSGAIGGGLTPVAAFALIAANGGAPNYAYLWMMIIGLFILTALAAMTSRETSREQL